MIRTIIIIAIGVFFTSCSSTKDSNNLEYPPLVYIPPHNPQQESEPEVYNDGRDYPLIAIEEDVDVLISCMVEGDCVYGSAVGIAGLFTKEFACYRRLCTLLSDKEMFELVKHPNANVRVYAIKDLFKTKSEYHDKARQLLKSDTATVLTFSGCSGLYLSVKDFIEVEEDYDYDPWCEEEFWKDVDLNYADTLTFFESHSLCVKTLPSKLYQLTKLQELLLGTATSFESLSPDLANLKNLEILLIQKSQIEQLPEEICELNKLKRLTIAWGGQLDSLPENIGQLHNLEYLDLYRNKLTTLPVSIEQLTNLKTLRLGENNFSKAEQARIKALLPYCTVTF